MKNKLLAPTLLSMGFFILLTPIFAIAQDTPEPVELKLKLREEITENQVKELLADKDYLITNLKGEVKVGDETITDFISKGKGETLEDVDELFQEQRQTLLVNMLQTQELSEENSEEIKQQFSKDELLTTIRETKKAPAKVKEISVITENQDKAQAIKDSLQNRSEIKDIRESIKEIQVERKEVREENRALKWLRNTLNFLFAPLRAIATGTTPAWVPDFTSIAFFDTDEVGLNPYEDWVSFDNTGKVVTDIESHWWDTYVVADTGGTAQDVIGNFTNDDGTGWTGWRNLPQHQGTPNDTQDHELVSVGNTLYNFYRTKSTFDVAPYELFVRASYDGGYTWTSETAITDDMIAYSATKHYNDVCLSFYNYIDRKLQTKCVADPLTTDWSTVSWNDLSIPVIDDGNRNIDLESQFGSLWIAYTDDISFDIRSSYDNGVTWNDVLFGDTQQEEYERSWGIGGVELTAIGTSQWQNERLCLTAEKFDTAIGRSIPEQTCLFKYFDGNGQYNAWNWTPWQKQEKDLPGNSGIETTSDTSRLTQVARETGGDNVIRTLEYQQNPGRGYISYVRWDEQSDIDAIDGYERPAYEHEVILYSDQSQTYDEKTYLARDNHFGGCHPDVRYAASNFPQNYIDSRRSFKNGQPYCDSEIRPGEGFMEVSYTIGSTEPEDFEHSKYYFTYMYTDRGDMNIPVFKVQGQLNKHEIGCIAQSNCVTLGKYDDGSEKIIPPEGANNPFMNPLSQNPNWWQGDNYPFWYYE